MSFHKNKTLFLKKKMSAHINIFNNKKKSEFKVSNQCQYI